MTPIALRGTVPIPVPPLVVRGRFLSALLVALVVAMTGCGLMQKTQYGPDEELSADRVGYLRGIGAIDEGETVRYFSSSRTFAESGNFVTDRGVGAYWLVGRDEDRGVERARFDEIGSASLVYGSGSSDHDILITRLDGSQFHLFIRSGTEFADAVHAEIQGNLGAAESG